MKCFGDFRDDGECVLCEYREGCKFAKDDADRTHREDNQWKYNSEEYNDVANEGETISAKQTYTRDEMLSLASMLLKASQNRRLAKALEKKLLGFESIADVARHEGVSRQAAHRSIGNALARLLGFNCNRVKESVLLSLSPLEIQIVKLRREGKSYRDIARQTGLSRSRVFRMGQALATKIRLKWDTPKATKQKNQEIFPKRKKVLGGRGKVVM